MTASNQRRLTREIELRRSEIRKHLGAPLQDQRQVALQFPF